MGLFSGHVAPPSYRRLAALRNILLIDKNIMLYIVQLNINASQSVPWEALDSPCFFILAFEFLQPLQQPPEVSRQPPRNETEQHAGEVERLHQKRAFVEDHAEQHHRQRAGQPPRAFREGMSDFGHMRREHDHARRGEACAYPKFQREPLTLPRPIDERSIFIRDPVGHTTDQGFHFTSHR